MLVRDALPAVAPRRAPTLHATLTGVSGLVVDMPAAGFRRGEPVTVDGTTDGPAVLRLTGLAAGTQVQVVGGPRVRADRAGVAHVRLG